VNVIFLDIDGVLINRRSLVFASGKQSKADLDCVAALNHIVSSTNSKIVVSSTWRMQGFDSVRDKLYQWGVIDSIIDSTPVTKLLSRGEEIQLWIDEHSSRHCDHVDNFVILDDDDDMGNLFPYLIRTEFETGLTFDDADRAILMLSGDMMDNDDAFQR
jgi:hypothetical protein